MLYELLFPLRHDFAWLGFLNVLRYVPFRTIASTVTAMLLAFVLAPWFIRELQRKQIGQVVRSDGPESHKIKSGTPTMGGALILLCVLVPTILWCDPRNVFVWATTAVTAGYGVIGFLDDYLKIKFKNSKGVPGRYKLLGQFAICSAVLWFAFRPELDLASASEHLPPDWSEIRFNLAIPFVAFAKHPVVLPAWLYLPFAVTVVVWTSNAVNLTDGLDGLAIGPVMINAGTYLVWAYLAGATFGIAHVAGPALRRRPLPRHPAHRERRRSLSIYCGAIVGAGIGSSSGTQARTPRRCSWATSGRSRWAAGSACAPSSPRTSCSRPSWEACSSCEAVSVVVQVTSFKLTGKAAHLPEVAPIHHHYERRAGAEPQRSSSASGSSPFSWHW